MSTTQRNMGVCLHIEGVFSNDRFGINTYDIQIQAEFIHVFLLTHICRCLYFITFNLRNRHFCPPKCPRDKKGTKIYVPRVPGAQTRDNIDFYTLRILIVKLSYLIAIQYASLRLLLKIINLHKIVNLLIINVLTNCHFPIQNFEKMEWRISSDAMVVPVISDKWWMHSRKS